jgi:hypothetical protein
LSGKASTHQNSRLTGEALPATTLTPAFASFAEIDAATAAGAGDELAVAVRRPCAVRRVVGSKERTSVRIMREEEIGSGSGLKAQGSSGSRTV